MLSPSFVHLRAHSEYSIRDGLLRIKPWLKAIAQLQMPAVAITDYHNLFALVKFYRYAVSLGIKPIIGADINLCIDEEYFPVTILCQNQTGYKHLTELLSKAYLEGQTSVGEPAVAWEWLEKLQAGLIILSGGRKGDIAEALLQGQQELAEQRLKRWRVTFADRFYLELQRTGRVQEEEYIQAAIEFAACQQIPLVATNDVRFLAAEDFEAHEARVCIHAGCVLDDPGRLREYSAQQYVRTAQEMQELFADIPEALANTVAIAKRCSAPLSLDKTFLPNFPLPDNVSLEDYLQQQAQVGLAARQTIQESKEAKPINTVMYQQRLQIELDVINRMGFAGYFLIVADFIHWAKQQHIPVGPGRGSGAGSLVAYALGITALDPLEHELLFERFLNPERISMPDFDIDFCMERRDLVIEYVAKRYGRESVAQIITYGTMAAKAVVRDVGRVLAMPYGFVDKIAKLIPFELGMTLNKALENEERLLDRYQQEDEVATLINLAKKLEGITRNAGKHAGGVVIAPTRLIDFAPLYCEPGGHHIVTQFDKDDVEAVGLVKFDFLGLRTLTIIDWTLRAVNSKRQLLQQDSIDIETIPLNDAKTFQLLKKCETTAVFQLESRGMKELVRRLQPDIFEEITALVALFRPGPLQSGMVDDFIARKHGRALVHYPHPELEVILRPTYGVILYQEQVMQIAQTLGGYSLGSADILRRAMGKKKPEEMANQRRIFVKGAAQHGLEESLAEHIFDLMEKFAGYGFNKSHSAAYALIAYQTAWLKAHFPAEFMAAVLSSDMDNTDKVVGFLQECQRMKLIVLPPNINVSDYHFGVNQDGQIDYGLGALKGAGQAAIVHIVNERSRGGHYTSLFDFCQRLDTRKVSRRIIEPLIKSGAMDSLHASRSCLFASIDKAIKAAEQSQRTAAVKQLDMFAELSMPMPIDYVVAQEWSEQERLQGEKATLGWYSSGHPLQMYSQELAAFISMPINELSHAGKKSVTVGGMLDSLRVMQTRKLTQMAIATIADSSGSVEVTIFSQLYEQVKSLLHKEQLYIVTGNIEDDQYTGGVRIVAQAIQPFMQIREQRARRLLLSVTEPQQQEFITTQLAEILRPYLQGQCVVVVDYNTKDYRVHIPFAKSWQINPTQELLNILNERYGTNNVVIQYE